MEPRSNPDGYVLGLDVGEKRIGAAVAGTIAKLPRPIDTIEAGDGTFDKIRWIISEQDINRIVIGIPRNMSGEETEQSRSIREFAAALERNVDIPVVFADESLSSKRADEMAGSKEFAGASRDSLAACFILEEYFGSIDRTDKGE